MTQLTTVFPVSMPDAIDLPPSQALSPQPAAPAPATGQPCPRALVPSTDPAGSPLAARTGPLRSGNPRGNPNLAPRCGAKARTTGCSCRAPAMPNGRCRMHGGKSTGPRTSAGLANLAKAHTTHGRYAQTGPDAELQAKVRHGEVLARRVRLNVAAFDLLPWLPPAFSARLRADTATELQPPNRNAWFHAALAAPTTGPDAQPHATATPQPPDHNPRPRRDAHGRFAPAPPRPLRGRQAERARSRAEAAALAPWKLAIAEARIAMRQTMHQDPAAQRQSLKPNPTRQMPPAAHPGGGAPADAAPPSSPGPDGDATRAQSARIEFSRTNPTDRPTASCPVGPADSPDKILMQRGTVACPTGSTEPAGKTSAKTSIHPGTVPPSAGSRSVANPGDHRTRAQTARIEFSRTNPMGRPATPCPAGPGDGPDKIPLQRGTVACPTGPTDPAGKTSAKTSIQSLPPGTCPGGGTVPLSVGSVSAASPGDHRPLAQSARTETPGINPLARRPAAYPTGPVDRSGKSPLHPGAVRPAANPFRNALLAGTVCNTPDAHRHAAKVERAGGWLILMAIDAAQQAGQDWRPATAAVRQRLAQDANRQRPPCIRLAAPIAEVVRQDATPQAP